MSKPRKKAEPQPASTHQAPDTASANDAAATSKPAKAQAPAQPQPQAPTRKLPLKQYEFDGLRARKREELLTAGVDPYPYSYEGAQPIAGAIQFAQDLKEDGKNLETDDHLVRIAGRVWSKRKMGKAAFWDVRDSTGKIQVYMRRDVLGDDAWGLMASLDLADIIGVSGKLFYTQTGELSIEAATLTVLCKAVVNVPIGKETEDRTYYQLSDVETKYRERYLSWILDEVDRERMRQRGRVISVIRNWMENEGFLEVQTPTIENVYGGAEARPFKTEVWALNHQQAYLRISPELYLKRYIVAGFDKVFTICQNFRNEGIDYSHNPEFTMMEWYEAFTDYERQMERFENLTAHVCEEIHGSTKIKYQDDVIDFTPPWRRLTVLEGLREIGGIDADKMPAEQLWKEMDKRGLERKGEIPWGIAVMELFEELCEESLVQPVFVMDQPVDISPLTKIKRGDPRLVERFEPHCAGMEIGNAYSELTDPIVQLERFLDQKERAAAEAKAATQNETDATGSKRSKEQAYEDHPIDSDFVKAIGCGMPPTGGVGMGIDRMVMLMTNAATIREVIPFPMIKPKGK